MCFQNLGAPILVVVAISIVVVAYVTGLVTGLRKQRNEQEAKFLEEGRGWSNKGEGNTHTLEDSDEKGPLGFKFEDRQERNSKPIPGTAAEMRQKYESMENL